MAGNFRRLVRNMRKESEANFRYIVELEEGVWLAPWDGDPGRTLLLNNATRFYSERSAEEALMAARKFSQFEDAIIYEVKGGAA